MTSPTYFRNFRAYWKHVRRIISSQSAVTNTYHALEHAEYKVAGTSHYVLKTRPQYPLQFNDGSHLRFKETVEFASGNVNHIDYSIGYTRPDGFFFRYDKDPSIVRYPEHALCHLHVYPNDRQPRLITHSTNIVEVFSLVIATYYP